VAAAISIIRKIVPAGIGDPFRQLRTRDPIITHSSFTHDSMKAEKHHPASLLLNCDSRGIDSFAGYQAAPRQTSIEKNSSLGFFWNVSNGDTLRVPCLPFSPSLSLSLSLSLCLSLSSESKRSFSYPRRCETPIHYDHRPSRAGISRGGYSRASINAAYSRHMRFEHNSFALRKFARAESSPAKSHALFAADRM